MGVLDCSAPCLIEPVVSTKHLIQLRLYVVPFRKESPGALDGTVLYKTPLWGTLPLHVV